MQPWRLLLAVAMAAPSACGTVMTRSCIGAEHAYPYAAFVEDFVMMVVPKRPELMGMHVEGSFVGGLVSLPLDFVIDTIALPFDIVALVRRLAGSGRE